MAYLYNITFLIQNKKIFYNFLDTNLCGFYTPLLNTPNHPRCRRDTLDTKFGGLPRPQNRTKTEHNLTKSRFYGHFHFGFMIKTMSKI